MLPYFGFCVDCRENPAQAPGDSVYNDGKKYVPERQLRLCEREEKDG